MSMLYAKVFRELSIQLDPIYVFESVAVIYGVRIIILHLLFGLFELVSWRFSVFTLRIRVKNIVDIIL